MQKYFIRNIGLAGFFATLIHAGIHSGVALANDSTAELGAGGITPSLSYAVAMESEDLYLSQSEVRVEYLFKNRTEETVQTLVAFPMPEIKGDIDIQFAFPGDVKDNFLDFQVEVDGKVIVPQLQQQAFANGIDVSEALRSANISFVPFADNQDAAIKALGADVLDDFVNRGILQRSTFSAGKGEQTEYYPFWTLKSLYWWPMVFPPETPVRVKHVYKPGIGASAGLGFIDMDGNPGYGHSEYVEKYCIDDGLFNSVKKLGAASDNALAAFQERHLSYVLKTGANWAGPIGNFHLTIDKGETSNLVSFCGDGVKKTGPTTFELTAKNFVPEKDLNILFVVKPPQ